MTQDVVRGASRAGRSPAGWTEPTEDHGAQRVSERARRPTINDIARLARVSKKTVSRVINRSPLVREDTRERINAVIEETGFVPDPTARGLAFRRAFLIGMIYDNPTPQYVVNMQQGLLDGMRDSDYELVVHPCNRASPDFVTDVRNFVERQKLFGVVLPPSVSEDDRLPPILRENDCAYIRIASVALDEPDVMVVTNDHVGAAAAARHLLALGHRRIAHISGLMTFRSAHERRRGFSEALAAQGVKLTSKNVLEGAYTFESGIECAKVLLARSPRPTAIFAGNDEMAAGVLVAARQAGVSIPHDLSVVGYDDFQIAERVWPPLTTIHTPTREIGRIAADQLIRSTGDAHGIRYDSQAILPTLVVRESSGPAPAE
ncbi:LacI family DNA-binding transcriptional regulator [Pendulispora albinea]|uniref:LacI family DNA-binding transcriptional regulator n=1 Tax=Pendulispora albinea TaxID=2741071 RepID=A0ABZ2LNT7_9BACT